MEISVGKGGSSTSFMKHVWNNCWNNINYVAFAFWAEETASFRFNGQTFDIKGYKYKYFML